MYVILFCRYSMLVKINQSFLLQAEGIMQILVGSHQVIYLFTYACMYSMCTWPQHAGSMPPHSKYLWEEGMCTKSFKLVEKGIFQEEGSIASPVVFAFPPIMRKFRASTELFCSLKNNKLICRVELQHSRKYLTSCVLLSQTSMADQN